MTLIVVLLLGQGALVSALLHERNVRLVRTITLVFSALAFAASIGSFFFSLNLLPHLLDTSPSTLSRVMTVMLSGSFFILFLARGLMGRVENWCSFLLMAFGILGISTGHPVYLVLSVLLLWILLQVFLRVHPVNPKQNPVNLTLIPAACTAGFAAAAFVFPQKSGEPSPPLLSLSMLCLLFAFPLHFWLPRALPKLPFALATLVALLFPRVACTAIAGFTPQDIAPLEGAFKTLGLTGSVWCALASLAGDNLRERTAYLLAVPSALCLWAIGKGLAEEALFLLLTVTPPALLLCITVSILQDRLRYLELEQLKGIGRRLPLLAVFFVLAAFGIAFLPGSCSFAGITVLLENCSSTLETAVVGGSVLLLFLSAGHLCMWICFGDFPEGQRRLGDLNIREICAAVPCGAAILTGLWPWMGELLREAVLS